MDNISKDIEELKAIILDCCAETLEESATECVAEIQSRTPVLTGNLRRSMTHGDVNRDNLSIEVGSSLKYAEAVEEGHRQQVGRYVPAIGKKLVKDFVEGKHMIHDGLTIIENKIEDTLQQKINERLG